MVVFLTPNKPGRFFKNFVFIHKLKSNLVPKTAVIKLTKILMINRVAKPLTELVPKINNIDAASNVVILASRSEEHTSELQSRGHLVCRLLLEKKQRIYTAEY